MLAFGVGLTVIAWLLRYLDRGSFTPFVVYRLVLGLLVLGLVRRVCSTRREPGVPQLRRLRLPP